MININPQEAPKVKLKVVTKKVSIMDFTPDATVSSEPIEIFPSEIPDKAKEVAAFNKEQEMLLTSEEYELDYILQKYIEN